MAQFRRSAGARVNLANILLVGQKKLQAKLDKMKASTTKRIAKPAFTKALTPVLAAAKKFAPRRRLRDPKGSYKGGQLKKSLAKKVTISKREGNVWAGIGPAYGFERQIGVKRDGKPIFISPTRYAHLAEKGTRRSRPRPFLGKSLAATKTRALAILAGELGDRIEREAAKL